jgi:NhaP-type Na+/H+ or K+/H+ antiporter
MSAHDLNTLLAGVGGLALVLALFSGAVKGFISLPLAAMLLGIILGPDLLNVLTFMEKLDQHFFLEQTARISIAMGLVAISLRFSRQKLKEIRRPGTALVLFAMVLMWAFSSFLSHAVFSLQIMAALLIGAIITPTDPVVAGSITTGKRATENLPSRIRLLISFESGMNDGLAYLFVFLPLLFMKYSSSSALHEWFTRTLLWEVLGAVVIGVVFGYIVGKGLDHVERAHEIEKTDILIIGTTLAISMIGLAKLAGTDGILAVFVAGLTFSLTITRQEREEVEDVQEGISHLATLPIFFFIGLSLPWDRWWALGWRGILWAVLILLLRRLPALLLISRFVPSLGSLKDVLFMGWFGPIGVSALFYALLAARETGMLYFWEIGSLMVAISTLAHGLTAAPYSSWFGGKRE